MILDDGQGEPLEPRLRDVVVHGEAHGWEERQRGDAGQEALLQGKEMKMFRNSGLEGLGLIEGPSRSKRF